MGWYRKKGSACDDHPVRRNAQQPGTARTHAHARPPHNSHTHSHPTHTARTCWHSWLAPEMRRRVLTTWRKYIWFHRPVNNFSEKSGEAVQTYGGPRGRCDVPGAGYQRVRVGLVAGFRLLPHRDTGADEWPLQRPDAGSACHLPSPTLSTAPAPAHIHVDLKPASTHIPHTAPAPAPAPEPAPTSAHSCAISEPQPRASTRTHARTLPQVCWAWMSMAC